MPATARRRTVRRVGLVAALLLALAVVSQLALPPLAERRLTSRLERHGSGVEVSVSAFPAVTLLWRRADAVTIRARELRPGGDDDLGDVLDRLGRTDRLNARIGATEAAGVGLRDVVLRKRGRELAVSARLTAAATDGALPTGLELAGDTARPNTLVVSASILGRRVRGTATVRVRDGAIVVAPVQPVLRLVGLRVFGDRRLAVRAVDVRRSGDGYRLSATGVLR